MTVVSTLRELTRLRRLVIVGALLALTAAIVMLYDVKPGLPPKFESRHYEVGVASGAVLIDSQSSQAVDLGGGEVQVDVSSLAARAKLLANLLVTRPLRDDIANRSRVSPDTFITELSSTTEPGAAPAEAEAGTVRPDSPEANIIKLQTQEALPIITVNAQAPTEEAASRLATSTVAVLSDYLDSVAASNSIPDVRKLVMRRLGDPNSATSVRGPGKTSAAMLAIFLFGVWCAGLLALAGLSRAWTNAVADDAWKAVGADDPLAKLARERLADSEREASAAPLPVGVREGAHDDLQVPPPPDTTSRAA
jgi:hypothetical protein